MADQTENTGHVRRFLDEVYLEEAAMSIESATSLGIDVPQDRLDDHTEAAAARRVSFLAEALAELRTRFPAEELEDEDRLSVMLFADRVENARERHRWRRHILPGSIDGGPGGSATFLIGRHTIDSVEDAENYIARLRDIERALGELAEQLRGQLASGVRLTRRQADRLRTALDPYVARDGVVALLRDVERKIASSSVPDAHRADLIASATRAVEGEVRRGAEVYEAAIVEAEANLRTDDGVWSLPDGEAYYSAALRRWTTTDLTAAELHALGLAEVDRITSEMRTVLGSIGFEGTPAEFADHVRAEPSLHYTPDEAGRAECLGDATAHLEAALAKLPEYFATLPRASVEVRAMEAWREPIFPPAVYDPASPDGSRGGAVLMNLGDLAQTQRLQVGALIMHEGVPGHHLQVAIAQERDDIPQFRRYGYEYGAYIEGWALYAESLALEMGLYEDPHDHYGMLSLQLWRACRLVLDTGLHQMRWTRAQAIDYFTANSSMSLKDVESEVDRYIGSPGQATAYMVGLLRIRELRARAEDALGASFDIRQFHDVVLRNGALPLHALDVIVAEWIDESR